MFTLKQKKNLIDQKKYVYDHLVYEVLKYYLLTSLNNTKTKKKKHLEYKSQRALYYISDVLNMKRREFQVERCCSKLTIGFVCVLAWKNQWTKCYRFLYDEREACKHEKHDYTDTKAQVQWQQKFTPWMKWSSSKNLPHDCNEFSVSSICNFPGLWCDGPSEYIWLFVVV